MDKYQTRMAELQSYVKYSLWDAGAIKKKKEYSVPLNNDELHNVLGNKLNRAWMQYLKRNDHNW